MPPFFDSAGEVAAQQLKEQGNEHFWKGDFAEADASYSRAIEKSSKNAVLFTNRARARMKLLRWHDVVDDCLRSVELHRENIKAFNMLGARP